MKSVVTLLSNAAHEMRPLSVDKIINEHRESYRSGLRGSKLQAARSTATRRYANRERHKYLNQLAKLGQTQGDRLQQDKEFSKNIDMLKELQLSAQPR